MPRQFRLPMTLTTTTSQRGELFLAQSLDFDLVETGSSKGEAWENLMLAIQTYVEFGLRKGWDDFIIQNTPDDLPAAVGMTIEVMPPLELASTTRGVIIRHENQRAA
jgi:hypothetical protein